MKKARTLAALLLALALALSMAGCGSKDTGTVGAAAGADVSSVAGSTEDEHTDGEPDAEGTENIETPAPAATELELYNDNGVIITLTGIEVGKRLTQNVMDGSVILLEVTNNTSIPVSPQVTEFSVGDLSLNDLGDIGVIYLDSEVRIEIYKEEATRLIREEEANLSIAFAFRVVEGGPIIETPEITFPSVMK